MLKQIEKYQRSFWSGVLLAIRALTGLGIHKTVAVFFGPAGTTLFSHLQNFVSLFTQPIQDAVANGLINAFPKKSLHNAQIVGFSVVLLMVLISCGGLFLFLIGQFKESIFSFSLANWLLIIASLILFCFGLIVSAIYVAHKKLKLYSLILIFQWVTFFIIVWVSSFSLNHFLIFWLVFQAVFTFVYIAPLRDDLKFDFKIPLEVKIHFGNFLIMAITVWLSGKWVDYFVREYSIETFGAVKTGLWQSVERLSQSYRGLVISFLFLSLYPWLSEKLAKGKLNFKVVKRYYFKYLVASFFFLLIIYQGSELILEWFYDHQYAKASDLFQLQIIGDFFAFLSFPFAIYIMATIKTKMYIFSEILSAVIFVSFIALECFNGIELLIYAHILRFAFYLFVVMLFVIKSVKNEA